MKVNISYRNVTHYLKLGYNAIINQELEIKTIDLPSVSHVSVESICELCKSLNIVKYHKYVVNVKRHGYYGCRKCSREKFRLTYLNKKIGKSYIDLTREELKNAMILKNQSIPLTESEKNYKNISSKEYRLYKNEVRRISKKSIKEVFKNWEGYDFYDNEYIKDFLCLAHTDDRYPSIDHKVSIYYGYKNNIDPLIIADVENLCITKRFINSSKRHLLDSEYKIN